MKLRRKKPCDECPFRKKSMRGWLGPWTVQSILSQVHGEGGLACHKAVPATRDMDDETFKERVHVCVGSLLHANKSGKLYKNPELYDMQKQIEDVPAENILGYGDFHKHHGGDK